MSSDSSVGEVGDNVMGSLAYPVQAGELKQGHLVVMQGKFPCKITSISVSKTGKHGHAKVNWTAVDIFTGKKYEDSQSSSHRVMQPYSKTYSVMMICHDEDYIQYQDENGEPGEIPLPPDAEYLGKLRTAFAEAEAANQEFWITIQEAMGYRQVMAHQKK